MHAYALPCNIPSYTIVPDAPLRRLQDNQAYLYAMDRYTGAERWVYQCLFSASQQPTNVFVARGRVFFGCADGNVHAVNATDGSRLWVQADFKSAQDWSMSNVPGFYGSLDYDYTHDILYAGACLNYTAAFDAATGKILWRYRVRAHCPGQE